MQESDRWRAALPALLPNEEIWWWPECPDPAQVEMLIAWRMRREDLASFTNLTHIFSMGAGTEQWQKDGSPQVPIVRLSDPAMAGEMAAYSLHWVSHFQRGFDAAFEPSQLDTWGRRATPPPAEYAVGILGYGTIGRRIGEAFASFGYQVNAWSRSGTDDEGVRSFAGDDELADFLGASNAFVNVLPNTPATSGLLTAERFSQCAPGATFINIGRGSVLASDQDLITALDAGYLSAAVLDVTNPEPPPADSPLFAHPKIVVTPHIAGTTQVPTAAKLIAANIDRVRAGEQPFPVVDPSAGY